MRSWASEFLDEDDNDMGDPSWFFQMMVNQSRQSIQPTNTGDDMQFNAIERQLATDPDDCPGGCGWPAISCKCAELANIFTDSIARPELTLDECYGREVLRQNGICPVCFYHTPGDCECEASDES
jgi:hypothetical protein